IYIMDSSTLTLVFYVVIIFGTMYFLMIRPQQKQQKQRMAMIDSLRVRDKIITAGGLYGKITKVKDASVIVQIADKVEVEIAKSGIISVENRDVSAESTDSAKNNKKNNDKTSEKIPEKAEAAEAVKEESTAPDSTEK
ncbi:MAG TPA: preprotein translocase subunit YajC, partial [Desulfitobacteriaceae bacterium]|nr:preprotein translocase subunit YajC [Desulfitobacteriaceae bacterium]